MNPFKKKTPSPPVPSQPLNTGNEGTPSPEAFNPDLPSCPFLNAPNCPYTVETKDGCPYIQMVTDKAINVPAYCPLTL